MVQHYLHIASIDFFHHYYGADKFNGLTINWTNETSTLMENLQILVKPGFGGISILCSDIELLRDEQAIILLRISPKDPEFFIYTDFGQEFSPKTEIFFFTNGGDNNSPNTLQHGEYVSKEDCIDIINRETVKEITSKINDKAYQVWEDQEPVLELRHFSGLINDTSEKVFYVEKNNKKEAFYKPRAGMEKKPFGLIALEVHQLYAAYMKTEQLANLQIRFKNRETIWKYILADKVFEKFSELSITDTQENGIRFKEGEFEINADWKVKCFESETEIPFRLDLTRHFQVLEKSKEGKEKDKLIFKQLPEAKPDQLHRNADNIGVLYSHIFI